MYAGPYGFDVYKKQNYNQQMELEKNRVSFSKFPHTKKKDEKKIEQNRWHKTKRIISNNILWHSVYFDMGYVKKYTQS